MPDVIMSERFLHVNRNLDVMLLLLQMRVMGVKRSSASVCVSVTVCLSA